MHKQRIVFHTGYMKTASTFLQMQVFPRLPDVELYTFRTALDLVEIAREVKCASPVVDQSVARQRFRDAFAASQHELQLFSWEGFAGDFEDNFRDFLTLTGFIDSLAPDIEILVVIRRQADLIESLYKQALHVGHSVGPLQFVNYRDGKFGRFYRRRPLNIDIRSLDLDATIAIYEKMFGAERVHVIPFEWLSSDRDRFFSTLRACLGRDAPIPEDLRSRNVGYSPATARLARGVNRMFRMRHREGGFLPYRPFDRWLAEHERPGAMRTAVGLANRLFDPRIYLQRMNLPGRRRIYPQDMRDAIMRHHAAGNRALDERRKLGLEALGYY